MTGSAGEEGQEHTALPGSDSSAFDARHNIAQVWARKDSVSCVSSPVLFVNPRGMGKQLILERWDEEIWEILDASFLLSF